MKTISTLILTAIFATCSLGANAQSWSSNSRTRAPHENSAYFKNKNHSHYRNNWSRNNWGHHDFYYDTYCPITFEVGYVNKRFAPNYSLLSQNLWSSNNGALNGFQIGFAFQPTSNSGVGLRTGMFYEFYCSAGNGVKSAGYNNFTEHDLYFPFQFAYNLPVSPDVDINFFTGLGFNLAVTGVYRNWGTNGYSYRQEYGNNYLPDRINAMWEFGANVRYNHLQFGMSYGIGMNDQELQYDSRTRQDKFTLSAAYVF